MCLFDRNKAQFIDSELNNFIVQYLNADSRLWRHCHCRNATDTVIADTRPLGFCLVTLGSILKSLPEEIVGDKQRSLLTGWSFPDIKQAVRQWR